MLKINRKKEICGYYHNFSEWLSFRFGFVFFLGLVTGFFAIVENSIGSEDNISNVSHARALSRVYENVAETIIPAVVRLKIEESDYLADDAAGNSPGQVPSRWSLSGSGVIIEFSMRDKSALILTTYSNVQRSRAVTVEMGDGRKFKTRELKGDKAADIAIIRIHGIDKAKVAEFGDSDRLKPGQLIMAAGCPFGLPVCLSIGIISGKGRQVQPISNRTMIQTDAASNSGSAGGPLVNLDGKVVGIVSTIASQSGGFEGVTFAVPINNARFSAGKLIKDDPVNSKQ